MLAQACEIGNKEHDSFLLSFQPYPKVFSGFCFCVDLIARCDRTIIAEYSMLSHHVVTSSSKQGYMLIIKMVVLALYYLYHNHLKLNRIVYPMCNS